MSWLNSVYSAENGYFPAVPKTDDQKDTDKLIEGRLGLFLEEILKYSHNTFLSDDKLLTQLGAENDLPDPLIKLYLLFLRGMYDAKGKLGEHWKDFLFDLERPAEGWYYMITKFAYYYGENISNGTFEPHPDSDLGKFFRNYYDNYIEYAEYVKRMNEQITAGVLVGILKPREYFRMKAKGGVAGGVTSSKKGGSDDGGVLPARYRGLGPDVMMV